jgi:hypothetical protein
MGDRQCHRIAGAARRIDESEIRDVGGRRQLEDATRNATVDDFLAESRMSKCQDGVDAECLPMRTWFSTLENG